MTSQATNRRGGGFTSCRGCSQKLRAITSKELETMRAAQKLLGEPTIGRGSARAGGGGGGSQQSQIRPHAARNVWNGEKQVVSCTVCLINCRKCHFSLKSTGYTPKTFFEEYINFKNFHSLKHCGVTPVQSFGSHIRPQPPRLGLGLSKQLLASSA